MKTITMLFVALAVMSQMSCNSSCDEFIGDWVMANGRDYFEIKHDGSNLIITSQGTKYALSCEKDKLIMKGVPMMGSAEIVLTDNGNILLLAGKSYERLEKKIDCFVGEFKENRFNSSITISKKGNDNQFLLSIQRGNLSPEEGNWGGVYSLQKDGSLLSTDGTEKKFSCQNNGRLGSYWRVDEYKMYSLEWMKVK